jgi:hypothetical protein
MTAPLAHAILLGHEVRGRWMRLTPERPSLALALNLEAAYALRDVLHLAGFCVWAALVDGDDKDAATLPDNICRCMVVADEPMDPAAQRLLRLMRQRSMSVEVCAAADLGAGDVPSLVEAANVAREVMAASWAGGTDDAYPSSAPAERRQDPPLAAQPRGNTEISPRARAIAQASTRRLR